MSGPIDPTTGPPWSSTEARRVASREVNTHLHPASVSRRSDAGARVAGGAVDTEEGLRDFFGLSFFRWSKSDIDALVVDVHIASALERAHQRPRVDLTPEMRESLKKSEAEIAAGNFIPGPAMFLKIAVRALHESIVPRLSMDRDSERWVANIEKAMADAAEYIQAHRLDVSVPIDMILHCPKCQYMHVDEAEPEKGWTNPPHKSHLCHECKWVWRPADVPTNGVAAIRTRGEHDSVPRPCPHPELPTMGRERCALCGEPSK